MKHNFDNLLQTGFIIPMKDATWLSPTIIVPKKNSKFCIYIDFRKLNPASKMDPYPLRLTEGVLDIVARHEIYSFLDRYFQ